MSFSSYSVVDMSNQEERMDSLSDKIDGIYRVVIKLETRFDNGPGTWPTCVAHKETLEAIEKRINVIEQRMWLAIGGATAFVFFIDKIAPWLKVAFKST